MMHKRGDLVGPALVALALFGCAHGSVPDTQKLVEGKRSAYLAGAIRGAALKATVNARDFVYAIDVSPDSKRVAFTHLAVKFYRLGLFGGPDLLSGDKPPAIADPEINITDFDPEGLAWSPDGTKVAVASRDTTVRVYDAQGKPLLVAGTEEPLASLAWSPDGRFLVAGSELGLITVLNASDLSFGYDLRAHHATIRSLAFADDGTLWSGSWDKLIRAFTIKPEARPVTETRLHIERKNGLTTVRGVVNGKASATFTVDARSPNVLLTPEAATRAGIDPSLLADHLQQLTPGGTVELPVARDQTLSFKNLVLPHVDVAVCGSCAAAGTDGVLGESFIKRFELVIDDSTNEAVVRLKDTSQAQVLNLPVLTPGTRFSASGYVEDLTVSRDGTRLGVAIDETKPERNLDLYKREKAGQIEPQVAGNYAAILDAKDGRVLEKHGPHHGVVATAGISPDGQSLASGGWDKEMFLFSGSDAPVAHASYGWCVRRVRFSRDGRILAVGAWTPNIPRDADSDPAAQLFAVDYAAPQVREAAAP